MSITKSDDIIFKQNKKWFALWIIITLINISVLVIIIETTDYWFAPVPLIWGLIWNWGTFLAFITILIWGLITLILRKKILKNSKRRK